MKNVIAMRQIEFLHDGVTEKFRVKVVLAQIANNFVFDRETVM